MYFQLVIPGYIRRDDLQRGGQCHTFIKYWNGNRCLMLQTVRLIYLNTKIYIVKSCNFGNSCDINNNCIYTYNIK